MMLASEPARNSGRLIQPAIESSEHVAISEHARGRSRDIWEVDLSTPV